MQIRVGERNLKRPRSQGRRHPGQARPPRPPRPPRPRCLWAGASQPELSPGGQRPQAQSLAVVETKLQLLLRVATLLQLFHCFCGRDEARNFFSNHLFRSASTWSALKAALEPLKSDVLKIENSWKRSIPQHVLWKARRLKSEGRWFRSQCRQKFFLKKSPC